MRTNGGLIGRRNNPTGTRASGVWKWSEYITQSLYGSFPRYTTGYDLTTMMNTQAEWNGVYVNIGASGIVASNGSGYLTPDGTKYFRAEAANGNTLITSANVRAYTLTTPFNISSAALTHTLNVAPYVGTPGTSESQAEAHLRLITFNDTGTIMYIGGGSSGGTITSVNLSSAWNISTNGTSATFSANTSGTSGSIEDLVWKPDGTRAYVLHPNKVTTYRVSTPFMLNTAVVDLANSFYTTTSNSSALYFKDDGTQMFVTANNSSHDSRVYKFDLAVAWNPSTATQVDEHAVGTKVAYPRSMSFNNTGSKMIIFGSISSAEYTLKTPWTINAMPTFYGNTSVSYIEDGFVFKPDGRMVIHLGTFSGDKLLKSFELSVPFDITSNINSSPITSINTISSGSTTTFSGPLDLFFKPDGTRFYIVGSDATTSSNSKLIVQFDLTTPWVITSGIRNQVIYDTNITSPTFTTAVYSGIFFSPDGTRMYTACIANDRIFEFSLTSPWDISSASYVRNKSISSQMTICRDVHFNENGTKMFAVGDDAVENTGLYRIYQYTLSTPWNISTALYDFVRYNFPIGPDLNFGTARPVITGLTFSPDGTKLFVTDDTDNKIYQFAIR